MFNFNGVWLPVVTPFCKNGIDFPSLKSIIEDSISHGISGIVLNSTTGESCALTAEEALLVVEKSIEFIDNRVPVILGVTGNNTSKMIEKIARFKHLPIQGLLCTAPCYTRPNQQGILEHFKCISESTALPIIIYNIPYRTGCNIDNNTLHQLATYKNIVGLKDCSGSLTQSIDLLLDPPENFNILAGDDAYFYTLMLHGAHGGILASSHLKAPELLAIYRLATAQKYSEAQKIWKGLYRFIPHLFEEPNPAPVKFCLKELSIVSSDDVRLPLTPISAQLKWKLRCLIDSNIPRYGITVDLD